LKLQNERLVLLLLAAIQFTTNLDFLIILPLGPQYMRVMRIIPAQFNMIVAAYAIAAGVSGEFQQTHWVNISLRSLFGLGYLITFGSIIAFTSYTWLLQRVAPALVATHTYANPVVAVLLGWLLAREPLSMRLVLASVAILGAIVLIRRGEQPGEIKRPESLLPVAEIKRSQECA